MNSLRRMGLRSRFCSEIFTSSFKRIFIRPDVCSLVKNDPVTWPLKLDLCTQRCNVHIAIAEKRIIQNRMDQIELDFHVAM